MIVDSDTSNDVRDGLVRDYLHLTREVMPHMSALPETDWPVVNDHCFQRIVLDTISGGVWYDHIPRPAYKHLTMLQAEEAVALCRAITAGTADLYALNLQSLKWRGKAR
ncbi:hypothetical protein ACERZ8_09485 [Tateyamaria armeniaca]|uniref:Uncharacterized protein n=1 Tax=Tateyamaria armeniaca TaxID=2518930 RepID=A0ABW8USK8_9RHOB